MCGILGVVGDVTPAVRARFACARDLLAHRGPDDAGVFALPGVLLGHRRLSIVDLTAAGHQPMVDPESGAVIVFNGMIYNYVELRRELAALGHRFRSDCDTEVLLKAVVQWGERALARLNGMWAFAAWLPAEGRLLFARDRFGVKPFVYRRSPGAFAFASEPKALLRLAPGAPAVNTAVLAGFLTFGGRAAIEQTFYEGVGQLPPAHYGVYRPAGDSLHISRYWDYPTPEGAEAADARERFAALFDDAVRVRLRGDVPAGVTLSGGLDSTAVLAAAVRADPEARPACLTSVYGDGEHGEAEWAERAAGAYGLSPVRVTAPRDRWISTLERVSWHMDAPCTSPAVFPVWEIMAAARERGVRVLLEGQGADEVLGGYSQHMALAVLRDVGRAAVAPTPSHWGRAVAGWRAMHATFGEPAWQLLAKEAVPALRRAYYRWLGAGAALRPEMRAALKPWMAAVGAPDGAPGRGVLGGRLTRDHGAVVLPELLQYGDALSMAHGVESRMPFMDHRLVEWAFSLRSSVLVRSDRSKWMLRDYLTARGHAPTAARTDKLGYPTPTGRWMLADGGAVVREWLLRPDALTREYCDPAAVGRLLRLALRGAAVAQQPLYRLLSTELWLRACVRGGANPPRASAAPHPAHAAHPAAT